MQLLTNASFDWEGKESPSRKAIQILRRRATARRQSRRDLRTSMLLTAGLLRRLRCRCILASGDLAAAAHERHITAAAAAATIRRATTRTRAVAMGGAPLLRRLPCPLSLPAPAKTLKTENPFSLYQRRPTPPGTAAAARPAPRACLRISKQCGGWGWDGISSGTLSRRFLGASPSRVGRDGERPLAPSGSSGQCRETRLY